jgi:hypothetical protein
MELILVQRRIRKEVRASVNYTFQLWQKLRLLVSFTIIFFSLIFFKIKG